MEYNPYDNTPSGTIRAQLENGLDLTKQDRLRLHHIAQLEYPGERETSPLVVAWMKRIETAVEWGVLPLPTGERYHRTDTGWPHIGRDAYRAWRATQPDTPAGSYIPHLWLGHAPAPAVPPAPRSEPAPPSGVVIEAPAYHARAPLIDQRVAAIVDALKASGIDPLAVPTGSKAKIRQQLCDPPRLGFTSHKGSTFDKAWQEAVARNLVRMAEHDRFCPM